VTAASDVTAGYSIERVAAGAGVEPGYVRRLIDEGIIASTNGQMSVGDMRRVAIVRALDQSGLPVEALGEAMRRGQISLQWVDQVAYERFGAQADETFEGAAARIGVPIDQLVLVREAMGFAAPAAGDRLRQGELAVLALLEFWQRKEFRPDAVRQALRSYGRAMRLVAETSANAFRSEILGPLYAAGYSFEEIGEMTADLDPEYTTVHDAALLAILHGQESHAWMRNIFEGFEDALDSAGLRRREEHPPAICFLDLSDYTRITDESGDRTAADLADQLERLVGEIANRHTGRIVKLLGDGVMFHFRDPGPAAVAAVEMVEAARKSGLPPAHVGIHAGPVLFESGDYFGRTVNTAARIADYARRGEVIVSQELVDAAGSVALAFDPIGPVELKGLATAVTLYVARRPD
jgi:adenylate cyclase